jgi:hypothetical protein
VGGCSGGRGGVARREVVAGLRMQIDGNMQDG